MLSAMISFPPGAGGSWSWQSGIVNPWNLIPWFVHHGQTKFEHSARLEEPTSLGSNTEASHSMAFKPLIPPMMFST